MRRSGFRDEVDFGSDYFSHGLTCVKPVKLKVSEIKFPIGSGTCTFFASFWLGPTSVLSRTFPWITRISTEGLGEISSAILKYSRVVLKYSAIVVLLCFVKKPLTRLACIAEGGPILHHHQSRTQTLYEITSSMRSKNIEGSGYEIASSLSTTSGCLAIG